MDFAFIDSGMGGIPYMLRLRSYDNKRSCVYLADTASFPYGEKERDEVIRLALHTVGMAVAAWKPRAVVIACNTMSVHALDALREEFPNTAIVGTVPAIKLAASITRNRRIGFLATDATVASEYSRALMSKYASGCTVFPRGASELVAFVEHHIADATEEEKESAVRPHTDYFAQRDCDTIILGCTHFTHLYDVMKKVADEKRQGVNVVDSRDGVAKRALSVLQDASDMNGGKEDDGAVYVTGDDSREWQMICSLYGLKWKGNIGCKANVLD